MEGSHEDDREPMSSPSHLKLTRETAVLRQCLLYAQRQKLEERVTQDQRDERCVRRAVFLMALLTALAVAGLCYSAVFLADFPQNKSHLVIKVFGALGLASLISLLAFVGFWVFHRRELDQRHEECRRLSTRLLESRLRQIGAPEGNGFAAWPEKRKGRNRWELTD